MLDEDRAAGNKTRERIAEIERIDVIERHEIDVAQLDVRADRLLCHREKIGRRQSLLFRAVHWIGLHFETEEITDDGRNHFIGSHRAVAAHRVAAHGESVSRPNVRLFGCRQRKFMIDAEDEIARRFSRTQLVDDAAKIAGAYVATAPNLRRRNRSLAAARSWDIPRSR